MVNEPGNQLGSLERLGIELETQPPENILTPGEAKGARFQISQPKGYYPTDVDTFMESSVIPSLGWYANALHERDLDIHRLGEKLDQAEVDVKNLRTELAAAQYSAPLGAALEKNQDDKEMTAILEQLEQARLEVAASNAALATATAALAAAEVEANQFKEYSAQQDDYITALLSQMEDPDAPSGEEASEEAVEEIADESLATPTFVEPQPSFANPVFSTPVEEEVEAEEYVFEPAAEESYVEPQQTFEPAVEAEPYSYPAFTPAAPVTQPEAFPTPVEDFPKADPYSQFYDSAAFLDESEPEVVETAAPAPAVEEDVYEEEALAIIDPFEDEEPEPEEYDEDQEDVFAALNNPTPTRINPADSPAPRVNFPNVPRRTPIPDELPQGIRPDDLE